jgi:uncharacterized membrane protein YdjX (TVP38/TMEM64 family)
MRDGPRLVLAALLALAGLAAFLFLPLAAWLEALVQRAHALGPLGAYLFLALFVPACLLGLPGTPITLFCGYTYGFWATLPAAILMSNLGAQAAFGASRCLLSGAVRGRLRDRPRIAALLSAVGERSFRIVFLLRLTPAIPFNALNYALGVTPLRFAPYAAATLLGMLPGTTVNTYTAATLGELGRTLDGEVSLGWTGGLYLGARLAAAVAVTVLVTRGARRALAEAAGRT